VLDGPLDLERRRGRGDGEGPALGRVAPTSAPARAAMPALLEELALVEPSDWELAAPLPERQEEARAELEAARRSALHPEPRVVLAGAALHAEPAGALEAAPAAPASDPEPVPEVEIDALEVHVERAATWRRTAAWAVDGVPFAWGGVAFAWRLVREAGGGASPPAGVDGLLDLLAREQVIALSVGAAVALALATYATLAHALAGATLGKWLLGLRVIGPDGGPPSPARSAVRSLASVASAGFVGLGFLLALFTRSGRALHDLIARTWVVKAP
jgi:uncharacterized RDD family membrane protein YckC